MTLQVARVDEVWRAVAVHIKQLRRGKAIGNQPGLGAGGDCSGNLEQFTRPVQVLDQQRGPTVGAAVAVA
ncbi:hypothetical protein SDC9_145752 [bioreactor metagenome]|uniref:Uncharacterized protein n=1 Tax=bioreactor metagenome TaxID=1076179 RepID=A0A645E981_9ZZZZ